jgi:hypothetical protein
MEIDEKDLCKLFVHRIPRGTSKDRIKAIFTPDDQSHIVSVEGEFLGDAGRTAEAMRDKKTTACFVTFDDSKSADGAFDRIDTPALNVDAMNRPQKFIEIDSDACQTITGKESARRRSKDELDRRRRQARSSVSSKCFVNAERKEEASTQAKDTSSGRQVVVFIRFIPPSRPSSNVSGVSV